MTAYEEDINTRRAKLRDMFRNEDAELTRELIDRAHRRVHTRTEETRKYAEKQRQQDEENRRAMVTLKRQQQYLVACPEARDKVSREITRGVKYSNLVQILEKNTRQREEKQLDTHWHEIMIKENNAHKQREEDELRKRKIAEKDAGMILLKQMTSRSIHNEQTRRLREQERQELEQLWQEVRDEEILNLKLERAKRQRLKRDLEDQLISAERRIVERLKHDAEVNHKLKIASEREIAKEQAEIAEYSANLRNEMMAYMKNLKELREQNKQKEAEVEAIVQQSAKDVELQRKLAMKRYKEQRKRMLEEVLVGRKNQLIEKQEIERQRKNHCDLDREFCRKDAERNAIANIVETTQRREMALHYGQQLQAQQEQKRINKCLEAKVDGQKHWHTRVHEEEYQKLTEELINAPEIITPNAFKSMLKECAARCWKTEQKSLC